MQSIGSSSPLTPGEGKYRYRFHKQKKRNHTPVFLASTNHLSSLPLQVVVYFHAVFFVVWVIANFTLFSMSSNGPLRTDFTCSMGNPEIATYNDDNCALHVQHLAARSAINVSSPYSFTRSQIANLCQDVVMDPTNVTTEKLFVPQSALEAFDVGSFLSTWHNLLAQRQGDNTNIMKKNVPSFVTPQDYQGKYFRWNLGYLNAEYSQLIQVCGGSTGETIDAYAYSNSRIRCVIAYPLQTIAEAITIFWVWRGNVLEYPQDLLAACLSGFLASLINLIPLIHFGIYNSKFGLAMEFSLCIIHTILMVSTSAMSYFGFRSIHDAQNSRFHLLFPQVDDANSHVFGETNL